MRKYIFLLLVIGNWSLAFAWGSGKSVLNGDEYADQFNEYLNAGLRSSITTSVNLPLYAYGTDAFTLTDSLGEPAGFIYEGYLIEDSAKVGSAVMTLHEGIRKFPNRLDLYFGLATTYLYIDQPEMMIGIVESAMKQEKKNHHTWFWTTDEQLPDSADFIYDRVQEDFYRFVEAQEYNLAEKIVKTAGKYYPKRAEYVNDLAVVYYYRKDYKKALKLFRKALKLNPKDELIKANIEYLKGLGK